MLIASANEHLKNGLTHYPYADTLIVSYCFRPYDHRWRSSHVTNDDKSDLDDQTSHHHVPFQLIKTPLITVDKTLVCHSGMVITGFKPLQEATAVQGHQPLETNCISL